jgi:hypothetical protein
MTDGKDDDQFSEVVTNSLYIRRGYNNWYAYLVYTEYAD